VRSRLAEGDWVKSPTLPKGARFMSMHERLPARTPVRRLRACLAISAGRRKALRERSTEPWDGSRPARRLTSHTHEVRIDRMR
jgi:hypothetical protein